MNFEIHLGPGTSGDAVRGIRIRFAETTLTRLFRPGDGESGYVNAPPAALASWLLHNWWRLRFEPLPAKAEDLKIEDLPSAWRLAHDLRSIDEGYRWPQAVIWGQDRHVRAKAEADPIGVTAPVRYLTSAEELTVLSDDFESGVDAFLNVAAKGGDLGCQYRLLGEERSSPEFAAWRRLEAKLGFDPDDAPESLMQKLAEFGKKYGEANIEEAASATPGPGASQDLEDQVALARSAAGWECHFAMQPSLREHWVLAASCAPWQQAESSANAVRETIDAGDVLLDAQLAELCGVVQDALAEPTGPRPDFGIRLREPGQKAHRVVVRAHWRTGRRFQFARAFGDYLLTQPSEPLELGSLGPIAESATERQQFQRAFGAALLCPINNLQAFLSTERPDHDDIESAAAHFQVSPLLVKSTLLNHGVAVQP